MAREQIRFAPAPCDARNPSCVIPSVELAADCSHVMGGRVQVEVEIRRIIKHSVNLVTAGVHTVGDRVVISVVARVIEEINPNIAVVVTRRIVKMEGGHRTIKPVPGDGVAHPLLFSVEIEAGDTPPIVVSTIFELVAIKPHQELLMAVMVGRGHLMR